MLLPALQFVLYIINCIIKAISELDIDDTNKKPRRLQLTNAQSGGSTISNNSSTSADWNRRYEFIDGYATYSSNSIIKIPNLKDRAPIPLNEKTKYSGIEILVASKQCHNPNGGCKIELSIWNEHLNEKRNSKLRFTMARKKKIDLNIESQEHKYTAEIRIRFKNKYIGKFAIVKTDGNANSTTNQIKRQIEDVEVSNKLKTKFRYE